MIRDILFIKKEAKKTSIPYVCPLHRTCADHPYKIGYKFLHKDPPASVLNKTTAQHNSKLERKLKYHNTNLSEIRR